MGAAAGQGSVLLWLFCPNQPRGDRTILNGRVQLRDFIVRDALASGAVPQSLPQPADPAPPPAPTPEAPAPAAEPAGGGGQQSELAEPAAAVAAAAAAATTEPFWDLFDRTVLHNLRIYCKNRSRQNRKFGRG